ncbi:hypothetical protein GF327_03225 [Candidatus Woesearchaeota archaeon]|nr:hypothetical protein [Candidatus Woesearchaeota archaeon]
MTFKKVHKHPEFHGIEFFRNHKKIKRIAKKCFTLKGYERIGPGLLYMSCLKIKTNVFNKS